MGSNEERDGHHSCRARAWSTASSVDQSEDVFIVDHRLAGNYQRSVFLNQAPDPPRRTDLQSGAIGKKLPAVSQICVFTLFRTFGIRAAARERRRSDDITAKAIDDSARAELVAGARQVAESGLIVGSAGNLSLRVGERVLITRGGAELDVMAEEDCVEVGVGDSVIPEDHRGGPQPSSELALHLSIYGATDADAIVHTHSHYATVLSTVVDELPAIHYMINHLGGPVRVARYETFGTEELAASVIEALQDRTGAIMANHGAVVIAHSLRDAVAKAILLEWLASLYYHARLLGSPSILSEAELEAVRDRARKLRYGAKAGAR